MWLWSTGPGPFIASMSELFSDSEGISMTVDEEGPVFLLLPMDSIFSISIVRRAHWPEILLTIQLDTGITISGIQIVECLAATAALAHLLFCFV
jgi:hypothetical protein